jgi:hypothetical protein
MIDRRRFLNDSLLAAAGLSLLPAALAAGDAQPSSPSSSICTRTLVPRSKKDGAGTKAIRTSYER